MSGQNVREAFQSIWYVFKLNPIIQENYLSTFPEYQRRHTPIESSMSDYEKYIISQPDRTNARWTPFGAIDENNVGYYFGPVMEEFENCINSRL